MTIPDLTAIGFDLGDGVILRQFAPTDAKPVYETVIRNADRLIEFMHWMTPDYSLAMAEEFVERSNKSTAEKSLLNFGIFRDDELLGTIGFVYFDTTASKTEIGYWIDRESEGRGIVTRAARALIDFAFDELGLNRVEIRCSSHNAQSAAIPQRLGFSLEAHMRQSEFRNGTLHDFFVYGLLADEWETSK